MRFKPDLILISAGFDAHKKDDINHRYIGIAEKEYEWLTDQIVQVANRWAASKAPLSFRSLRSCAHAPDEMLYR